jgi:transketolase
VTIFATGHMVWRAIEAEAELEKEGISVEVINIHTIKPLDEAAILESLAKTGCAVSAEEHQMAGGLGESIASTLVRNKLYPMEFVAVNDQFGESGKPDQLLDKYGLGTKDIVAAAKKVIARKG